MTDHCYGRLWEVCIASERGCSVTVEKYRTDMGNCIIKIYFRKTLIGKLMNTNSIPLYNLEVGTYLKTLNYFG